MSTQVLLYEKPPSKEGIVFIGLPGIGLVGKIVVDYLVKELKPKKIGDILSDSFPPAVITKAGIADLFKDHVYYLKQDGKSYYFVAGPVIPNWDQGATIVDQYDFSRTLVAAFKELKINSICTIAGLNVGEERMKITPHVIGAATDKATLEQWTKRGIKPSAEGTIFGHAGLLLGIGKMQGIPGVCLMGETSARLVYGDPGACKAVLDLIAKTFGFKLKMDKMDAEAKEIEKAFQKLSETMQADEKGDHGLHLPYVR
ncbi:MAG: PAC2 family protein [Candidatus Diapherotrites archaeon]